MSCVNVKIVNVDVTFPCGNRGPSSFRSRHLMWGGERGSPCRRWRCLVGEGWPGGAGSHPPQRPLQGASWSASYACLARPLDQLAREERWDCLGGGGGRAVGLCVPHGSFSRMGWGQFRVAAVG